MKLTRAVRLFVLPSQAANDAERIDANLTVAGFAMSVVCFNIVVILVLSLLRHG